MSTVKLRRRDLASLYNSCRSIVSSLQSDRRAEVPYKLSSALAQNLVKLKQPFELTSEMVDAARKEFGVLDADGNYVFLADGQTLKFKDVEAYDAEIKNINNEVITVDVYKFEESLIEKVKGLDPQWLAPLVEYIFNYTEPQTEE